MKAAADSGEQLYKKSHECIPTFGLTTTVAVVCVLCHRFMWWPDPTPIPQEAQRAD